LTGSLGPVAICFGTYPPERNGGSDFVASFAAALARRGTEAHVITSTGNDGASSEDVGGVVVHRIVRDWTLRAHGREDLRRADGILRGAGIRILHVLFPDSVYQGRYQLPALIGLGRTPLVATWWNLGLGRRSPASIRAQSLALLIRARVLTSHDPSYLGALRRVALGRPVEWLPVGSNVSSEPTAPDAASARRALELVDGPIWLGFFGQLDPTRGVEDLFAALRAVRQRHDVRLVMIGSAGRPERYEAHSQSAEYFRRVLRIPVQLGIEDAVRWTPYLPDEEVINAFRAIDVCVLPYRRNSLGRSALATALETGTPTVLAGSPEAITPLRPGEHVAVAPRQDPAALAATLTTLVESPGERERLRRGALAAATFFSWDHVAERAAAVYARLRQ
jgi:glycosyltransferase involved in cell wall biosynthesis